MPAGAVDRRDFCRDRTGAISTAAPPACGSCAPGGVSCAVRDDGGGMLLRLRGSPDTLPVSRPFQGLFKPQ